MLTERMAQEVYKALEALGTGKEIASIPEIMINQPIKAINNPVTGCNIAWYGFQYGDMTIIAMTKYALGHPFEVKLRTVAW